MEDQVKEYLKKIEGRDLTRLISFLESSDFFQAPASANPKYHGAVRGGLVQHTLNVVQLTNQELKDLNLEGSCSSGTLAAMCHDLCKINFYVEDKDPPSQAQINFVQRLADQNRYHLIDMDIRSKSNCSIIIDWLKNDPKSEKPTLSDISWKIEDSFPFGHGEKSALIASRYVDLTEEELCAIRFHMGPWDAGIMQDHGTRKAFELARERFPLVDVLISADHRATIYERMRKERVQ